MTSDSSGPLHPRVTNPESLQLLARPALGVQKAAGGGELAVAKAVQTFYRS